MKNLFISLTCTVLFALSATTVTANAKIYSPQEITGGYVVVISQLSFEGEYDVMVSFTELGQRRMDNNMIIISAYPLRGGDEIVLDAREYVPGDTIDVDFYNTSGDSQLISGDEYAMVITQGGRLVDRFEFIAP